MEVMNKQITCCTLSVATDKRQRLQTRCVTESTAANFKNSAFLNRPCGNTHKQKAQVPQRHAIPSKYHVSCKQSTNPVEDKSCGLFLEQPQSQSKAGTGLRNGSRPSR